MMDVEIYFVLMEGILKLYNRESKELELIM